MTAPFDVKRYFVSPEESGQICMLACILGNGGEVFFPKLNEDQMLTFSAICDDLLRSQGWEKEECTTDAEAKCKAAELDFDSSNLKHETSKYPVVYFASDTTGEKAYEEFYVLGEKVNMQRFQALGVIEETTRRSLTEVESFFKDLESIFARADFTKAEVVNAIKSFLPNFQHEETGKNLDQKM